MTPEPEPEYVPVEPPVSGIERIEGDVGTVVSKVVGAAHTGRGDQHNYFGPTEIPKRIRQQPLGEEARRLAPLFVEPPGWERAISMLDARKPVLLHGESGSGIRSAALRLLSVCGGGGAIRELLPPVSPEDSFADLLKPEDVGDGDRLLVDLLDSSERLGVFQREFPRFQQAVREQNAYFAVVLPRDRSWVVDPELRSSLVHLGRPCGMRVLARHLQADGVEYQPGARKAEVEEWARSASMRDIATLASDVLQAREYDSSASFDDWLERVWNAPETASKVVDEIRKFQDKRLLPLMVAAAAFEGCSVDAIYEAEQRLLAALDYPVGEVHELDRPDLAHRLGKITTAIGPKRRVRFVAPRYGSAVLEHLWVNYPGQRNDFRDWIISCDEISGLDEAQWRSAARRFAEQVLRVERPDHLTRAAEVWVGSRRARMLTPAEELLVRGLRDPQGGRWVRQQFYRWSRDPGLHPDLAYLVVALCVQEIQPARPGEALTRLHHLYVHHDDAEVARSASDVLMDLAGTAGFLRRLLYRLAEPGLDRMAVARNHHLFLRVTGLELLTGTAHGKRPLAANPVVRGQLVICWRHVLVSRRPDEYEEAVRNWLTAHAHGDGTDPLLDVLVEGCGGEIAPLSALFDIGLRWLRESAVDNEAAMRRIVALRRLSAAIDRARAIARAGYRMSE